jgi:hypothetical protein
VLFDDIGDFFAGKMVKELSRCIEIPDGDPKNTGRD